MAHVTGNAEPTPLPAWHFRHAQWVVVLALLPGVLASVLSFGYTLIWQLGLAAALAIALEALCLAWRGQPLAQALDGSAVLTAALIAIALPPDIPLGILALAILTAIGLAKHLFGGLGQNLFNPAMVGYALVLVSYPAAVAQWPLDGLSGATPLDLVSHRQGQTFNEVITGPAFGAWGGLPWQWINAAFGLGGLLLVALRLARWRVSLGVLLGIGIAAAVTFDSGSSLSAGSPQYHWFTGATMLTAFFIATDPVTHPRTNGGQWLFGLMVGVLILVIRAYGSYPDGVAFAILLANAASPSIDIFIQRRRNHEQLV